MNGLGNRGGSVRNYSLLNPITSSSEDDEIRGLGTDRAKSFKEILEGLSQKQGRENLAPKPGESTTQKLGATSGRKKSNLLDGCREGSQLIQRLLGKNNSGVTQIYKNEQEKVLDYAIQILVRLFVCERDYLAKNNIYERLNKKWKDSQRG